MCRKTGIEIQLKEKSDFFFRTGTKYQKTEAVELSVKGEIFCCLMIEKFEGNTNSIHRKHMHEKLVKIQVFCITQCIAVSKTPKVLLANGIEIESLIDFRAVLLLTSCFKSNICIDALNRDSNFFPMNIFINSNGSTNGETWILLSIIDFYLAPV